MNIEKAQLVFEDEVRDLSQPIMRYLERYIGDRAVAEDMWQETMIRMSKGWDSFAMRSSTKTWAFSIASRVAADYLRQPGQKIHIVDMDEVDEQIGSVSAIDDRLVEEEMNDCVRQMINRLPDKYREVLILHDFEELTAEQTATICGCSLAAAKIRIHRARLRLKDALKKQCSFYHDSDNVLRCDRKEALSN